MSQLDAGSTITGKLPVGTQIGIQISRRRILVVCKQMLLSLFIATLAVMGVLTAFALPFFISYYVQGQADTRDPPLLLIVVLAGAPGAFFIVLMRLLPAAEAGLVPTRSRRSLGRDHQPPLGFAGKSLIRCRRRPTASAGRIRRRSSS
jgi:hypothetical protein